MFLNCGTVICRTLFFFSLFNCALILFKLVGLLIDYVLVFILVEWVLCLFCGFFYFLFLFFSF